MTPESRAALLDDVTAAWCAAIDGMTDYWAGALQRRAGPPVLAEDARRWLTAAAVRERPSWALPNEVVLENELARLRDFSAGSRRDVVPTLVLPPQAGHDSCIVDYSPDQSQIATIRATGLERTFSLDWKGATRSTRDASIEDYVEFIEHAVALLGGRVNLVGDCQGGWLATLWAALHPEAVHTLTIAGAPIDFHAGDAAIRHWVQMLTAGGRMEFYRALVAAGGGVLKGGHMLSGFITMGPRTRLLANCSSSPTFVTPSTSLAIANSRIGSGTRRTSRARSTCGSSSGSSATMR